MSPTLSDRLRSALAPEYAVCDEIAAGGQGHVFRAHDPRLRRDVAIKVLRPELATAAASARFLREAQVLARLRHPGILAVHAVGEADGLPYYVMDLAGGETLAERIRRGPLERDRLLTLARELLGALDAVHRAGIVHRDVKPSNIFLDGDRFLLGDFGVALVVADSGDTSARTEPGHLVGTERYMSPEQVLGAATERSDIYSAACVLFEAATGTPWGGLGDPATGDWRRVPRSLARPLRRALELAPSARWASAREFLAAVERSRRFLFTRSLATAAAGVAVLAIVGGWPARPAPALMSIADLAVLPFGRDDGLGRDLASFVASSLEWSPRWTFRPYHEVLAWWDSAGPASDAIAARRVSAARWVDGYVRRAEGPDTLVLRIHAPQGVVATLKVPGDSADRVRWATDAADSIVQHVRPREAEEFRELMAATSGDYEANQLLIAGTDAFGQDRWEPARGFLRAALERDPRLDRAAFELDLQYRWGREPLPEDLRPAVESAGARMPEPYGSLMRSEQERDLVRRVASLRAAVREYPHNARARFLLLNEAFHRAPLIGMPLAAVLEEIEDGIAASPYLNQVAMYDHLVWGYIHLGLGDSAHAALDRRARLVAAKGGEDAFGPLLRLAADARFRPFIGGIKARAALLLHLREDPTLLSRLLRFGLTFDVPGLQRQLAAGLRDASDARIRTSAAVAEGLAQLELGRIDEGLRLLDATAGELGPEARVHALAWRVVPAILGIPFADSAARRDAIAALGPLAEAGDASALEARWIVALDAAEHGATPRFPVGDSTADPGTSYLATILEGILLARAGAYDSALRVTRSAIIDDSSGAVGSPFARSVLHLRRGEWHRAAGRPADAERSWLYHENSHLRGYPDGVVQAGEVDAVLSPFARLRRAELGGAAPDAGACALARRVQELWAHADPVLSAHRSRVAAVVRRCR